VINIGPYTLNFSASDLRLYNLKEGTPIFDSAIQISKGFASFFTADEYLQNVFSIIMSPLFFILLAGGVIYFIYRTMKKYDQGSKSETAQGQQLLLFKAKQIGLSNYQFKILNGITDMLHLEKPSLIMDDYRLFERSIERFVSFASKMGEKDASLESICRDLIITYEKIYHPADIRKPLTSIRDLEINTLTTLCLENHRFLIAKLRDFTKDRMMLRLFAKINEIESIEPGMDMRIIFWRSGDAEYEFKSVVLARNQSEVELQIPSELTRGQTVPHPLVDIVIPCTLIEKSSLTGNESSGKKIQTDIFKINEYEALIRCGIKLEHSQNYSIEFTMSGFTVRSDVQILRERFIADRKIYYFNLKFVGISEAARTIISNFITEHLFA